MDRKKYIKDIYSKYWINAREKIYGFMEYDKNLCSYICAHVPSGAKLLDVGIGTGYPFADFFQKAGYQVYGVDISSNLIAKCQKLYPKLIAKVGDAENLDFADNYFDCVYCFHSTWYFPNLNKAVDEMVRVTRPGGLIMFDIENASNKQIDQSYRSNLRISQLTGIGRFTRNVQNIKAIIMHLILRRPLLLLSSVVHETPTQPESIYRHLEETGMVNFQVMVRNKDDSIQARTERSSFEGYPRLIFTIRK
jgi:ubiquinone/menaquinone biosynthesis C-methylase UbiE